eukprot:gnl/TRDRNA2_/TRDRNA2_132812_c0_seq1.p1 gnl/TRDRNA2_/TRDRNA2_132812_c0~~gnl/TRDRNA2_/TRDRNA2_132812_c0_seq1.p1  ORF type:complete len:201 (-),score=50.52 gnl/TRDRNA2_/TRDRNA2_132812_c0_seq1:72-674(-)
MAWAFAKAGVSEPSLFVALEKAAEKRLSEFNGLEIDTMAWALAEAGQTNVPLFAALHMQREVADALTSLGGHVEDEMFIEESHGIYVLVVWKSKQVAIEISGPRGKRSQSDDHEQLRDQGWSVVVVPQDEWAELEDNEGEQQKYLLDKLDDSKDSVQISPDVLDVPIVVLVGFVFSMAASWLICSAPRTTKVSLMALPGA